MNLSLILLVSLIRCIYQRTYICGRDTTVDISEGEDPDTYYVFLIYYKVLYNLTKLLADNSI
jgi:hypothetical protein